MKEQHRGDSQAMRQTKPHGVLTAGWLAINSLNALYNHNTHSAAVAHFFSWHSASERAEKLVIPWGHSQ